MPSISKFESLPGEVHEKIIVSLLAPPQSFIGPPKDLIAGLLISKAILKKVSLPHIYAKIFSIKFDKTISIRNLGSDCAFVQGLAVELVRRFECLKRLKFNDYATVANLEVLKNDLWTVYLMFLESEGKNHRQLIDYARVHDFAHQYVYLGGGLHRGTFENGGWTVDDVVNALVLWIFWFTDKIRIQNETPTEREMILLALCQFLFGIFKYTSTYSPPTSFLRPPTTPPVFPAMSSTDLIPSLAGSPIHPACIIHNYFGFQITIAQPLALPPAILSCVVRLEAIGVEQVRSAVVPNATVQPPNAAGFPGPTYEDIQEQAQVRTSCVDWEAIENADDGVWHHENDWTRLAVCFDPQSRLTLRASRVFTPGMLHGRWTGKIFITPEEEFADIVFREIMGQAPATPHLPKTIQVPIQFNIREYHQHNRWDTVSFNDVLLSSAVHGVLNAWFPTGTRMTTKANNDLAVYDPYTGKMSTYHIYNPAPAAPHPSVDWDDVGLYGYGVWDIILTAEVDPKFGKAWGAERYYGRVRDWDGLVMLVPETNSRWIFYGYVHGNQNLVGRFRAPETPMGHPGWSGVWSMVKENV